MTAPARAPLLWCCAIALATLLAFQPALRNEFCFDDIQQVIEVDVPTSASGWLAAAAAPWWPADNPHTLWRPVTRLSILAQKALHPNAPWAFYLANIALAALAAALLLAVALRLGFPLRGAGLAALIFALHPLHSEAVHQLVGRAETLGAIWMFAGLWLLLRWGWSAWWQPLAQAAACLLALGSKESAVVYPLLPLLLAAVQFRSKPREAHAPTLLRVGVCLAAMAAAAGLFVYLRFRVTHGVFITAAETSWMDNRLFGKPFLERLPATLGIFGFAAAHFFWPHGLSPDYSAISLPLASGWAWPYTWVGVACGIAAAAYCILDYLRRRRGWAIALAALGAYGVTSNILFTIGVAVAERLWFFPSAALCLGSGWALHGALAKLELKLSRLHRKRLAPLAICLLALLLISLDWHYAPAFRSNAAMADWVLDRYPDSVRQNMQVATLSLNGHDFATAYTYAKRALLVHPTATIYDEFGAAAAGLPGHEAEAAEAFADAIASDPAYAEAYRNMGVLLERQGRKAEALVKFREYLTKPGARHKADAQQHIRALVASGAR